MSKFLTSLVFAAAIITILPACGKKNKKAEPVQTEKKAQESACACSHDKESYSL